MPHIALLGDSVFDNKAYVGRGPDVVEQLRSILPPDWRATLGAIDGAVVFGVARQLEALPNGTTHIVISAGGNDALREANIIEERARSVAEVLEKLAAIRDRFRAAYAQMLDLAMRHRLPVAVCTIYDPRFAEHQMRRLGAVALSVINDAITREAFARELDVIDLRILFNEDADFANPIEPSVQGGMKLATAILAFAQSPRGLRRTIC